MAAFIPQENRFYLDQEFVQSYKNKDPCFGYNGLGKFVYSRTYSRVKDDGTHEEWFETVERVVNGTYSIQKNHVKKNGLKWNELKGQKSAKEMYDHIFNMRFTPPGRGLWSMGSKIIYDKGLFAALNNCGFVSTTDPRLFSRSVEFLMDMTMLGVGVGFDTDGANKIKTRDNKLSNNLNSYSEQDELRIKMYQCYIKHNIELCEIEMKKCENSYEIDNYKYLIELYNKELELMDYYIDNKINVDYYVIEDTREGWVKATKLLIESYIDLNNSIFDNENNEIFIDKPPIIFDYSNIRPKGIPLKTFGGISSGPKPLLDLHVETRHIFEDKLNNYYEIEEENIDNTLFMTLTDIADIMNLVGKAVVAGNVRRSSEICLSEESDEALDLKDYIKNPRRARHGHCSNNSIYGKIGMDYTKIANGIKYNGEPGLFWLDNVHNYGRMCGIEDYSDHRTKGTNPCLSGNTWVITENGPRQIKDIVNTGKIKIVHHGEFVESTDIGFFHTGNKELFEITTKKGFKIQATSNHLMSRIKNKTRNNIEYEWTELENLQTGDYLQLSNNKGNTWSGSGTYRDGYRDSLNVDNWDNKQIEQSSYDYYIGFIKSFFKKNRIMIENDDQSYKSILITHNNLDNLQMFQRMLSRFGIISEINQDTLNISGNNVNVYYNVFDRIIIDNELFAERYYDEIVSIKSVGFDDVYDVQIPEYHSFDANGLHVHNCCEQSLESFELCCLVEIFLNRINSLEEFKRVIKFAYLYAKTVTLSGTHWPETNRVQLRNRRIGCSLTGIVQFIDKNNLNELKIYCNNGYAEISKYDDIYSDWFCIPKSIRKTSIKPSGTVSLLAGATPGVHWPVNTCYIRRVRLMNDSRLIPALKRAGFNVEVCIGSEETTVVVEFPVKIEENIRTEKEVSMWEKLNLAAFMQEHWSDNQVSCTVTFHPDTEGDQIVHALNYYQYKLKGISFLPMHELGAYKQMPYEAITEDKYLELSKDLGNLDFSDCNQNNVEYEIEYDTGCDGGKCEWKP